MCRGFLPQNYSPLTPSGNGLQSVYLAEIGAAFASALFSLIAAEANQVRDVATHVNHSERLNPAPQSTLEEWERRVDAGIREDTSLEITTRDALVRARRGRATSG
jgi:putative restriction endonuclease